MSNAFNGEQFTNQTVYGWGEHFEMLPQLAPTAVTDLTQVSLHITDIYFTNVTGSNQTISVWDRQATPVPYFLNYTVLANSTVEFSSNGRWMPSGVSYQAGASNSIVVAMRGYGPKR